MTAYKFLMGGRVGLFSDYAWPPPGEWVETHAPLADCVRGIHAVAFDRLPDWIDDELWEIELGGSIVERDSMLVAERGRLVARVERWDAAAAQRFADACARRAAAHAAEALRRAGLADAADRLENADDLAGAQRAALAALEQTGDRPATDLVAFAADLVSLVGGGRPESWRAPEAVRPIVQTPGATAANVGFVAAHAAGRAAVAASGDEDAYGNGFASERAKQLAWFDELLRA